MVGRWWSVNWPHLKKVLQLKSHDIVLANKPTGIVGTLASVASRHRSLQSSNWTKINTARMTRKKSHCRSNLQKFLTVEYMHFPDLCLFDLSESGKKFAAFLWPELCECGDAVELFQNYPAGTNGVCPCR